MGEPAYSGKFVTQYTEKQGEETATEEYKLSEESESIVRGMKLSFGEEEIREGAEEEEKHTSEEYYSGGYMQSIVTQSSERSQHELRRGPSMDEFV